MLVLPGESPRTCSLEDALNVAKSKEMDLVEVSPDQKPPVCKLMDFGRYLYKKKKQMQESRKKTKTIETKVIRMSFRTEKHDLEVKMNQARKFIEKGHPIKFNMVLHGRETQFMDQVNEKYEGIAKAFEDIAYVEMRPKKSGFSVYMILQPIKR